MFTIGCHLSISKGFAQTAHDAVSIGANTFQFFTRSPRGGAARALDDADIAALRDVCADAGIERILAHAPYTLNPASDKDRTVDYARMVLADDLDRMERIMPGQLYNMHPGAHVGQGVECAIEKIADCINAVYKPEHSTTLLLETMAGKGSEVGRTFEELAAIIERLDQADRVGVCLDTCHVWDGGYDVAGALDAVLEDFDRVLGVGRLRAVHLNDSKNPCGAHKDRHACLGEGCIGYDALVAVTTHPLLRDLPFYLETPQPDLAGYAAEISALASAREA